MRGGKPGYARMRGKRKRKKRTEVEKLLYHTANQDGEPFPQMKEDKKVEATNTGKRKRQRKKGYSIELQSASTGCNET